MERRDDIRAAMQNLLTSNRRAAPGKPTEAQRPIDVPGSGAARNGSSGKQVSSKFPPPRTGGALTLSEKQINVLKYLQVTLRDNGINAELPEVVQALVEALTARRELCEGLLAAYLLDPTPK